MSSKKRNADVHEAAWIAEEDAFVLGQAYKKAQIRVKEGRAKPIDCLAVTLWLVDETRNPLDSEASDSELNVPDPETLLDALDESQLQDLEKDLTVFTSLETKEAHKHFWNAVSVVCKLLRQQAEGHDRTARGIHNVSDNVGKLLGSKSYDELVALEKQINNKLNSKEPVDTDYWQSILEGLSSWKAKARLRMSSKKVSGLSMDAFRAGQKELPRRAGSSHGRDVLDEGADENISIPSLKGSQPRAETSDTSLGFLNSSFKALPSGNLEEALTDEGSLSGDPSLQKPNYSGRALMGFEWNKYNQTHYDSENPPPKVVQGYEFNIHYPALLGTSKAPTFKIVRDHGRKRGQIAAPAGEEDRCKIVFKAPRPYEDLVFRIVDREWDYSAKRDRGFESMFENVSVMNFAYKFLI